MLSYYDRRDPSLYGEHDHARDIDKSMMTLNPGLHNSSTDEYSMLLMPLLTPNQVHKPGAISWLNARTKPCSATIRLVPGLLRGRGWNRQEHSTLSFTKKHSLLIR